MVDFDCFRYMLDGFWFYGFGCCVNEVASFDGLTDCGVVLVFYGNISEADVMLSQSFEYASC